MKKLFISIIAITLISVVINDVHATNQSSTANKNIDITENHFVNLDEEGNPVIVEIDDTFNKKEYQKSLEEYSSSKNIEEINSNQNVITIQDVTSISNISTYVLNLTKQMLPKTSNSYNNHIVRFKTVAELDGNTVTYTEADTGRQGYFSTNAANDAAYIATNDDGTITCKLGGVVMKVPASCVKSIVPYSDGNISYYYANEGKFYHYYSYISGSTVKMAVCRVGFQPNYITNKTIYYSYDGHYFYNSFASMITDYKNYSSQSYEHAVNKNNPYYSYYQYLSLRSKTTYTATQLNSRTQSYCGSNYTSSKMYNHGQTFINNQNTYGINASLMFGVAYNESAAGTSNIAKNKNNIFGLNAVDKTPSESANYFTSVDQCIKEFAYDWMSTGYLNGTDSRYRGPHLGDKHSGINVKYASDPYWGEKAAAQSYYIADNSKEDYEHYKIGISKSTELSLYKDTNTSKRIYTSGATGSGTKAYLYDYPVLILETPDSWHKVQSDMPLKSDRSSRDVTAKYDFNRDYVYAQSQYISTLSDSPITPTYLKGDVNGDGKVTSLDYIQIKNHIMGSKILTGDTLSRADVNNDGKVTSLDYMKIKNHIMGTNLLF